MKIHNFLHDDYLRPTKYIGSDHPMTVKKSMELKREDADEMDYLRLMKLLQENDNVLNVHSNMLPGEF